MKKLTEEWKAKKGSMRNLSFRDSIDCDLSNSPESKQTSKKSHLNTSRKKQSVRKSSISHLCASPVVSSKGNVSLSLRRSGRLKEKTVSTKPVDKKVKNYDEGVSFLINESFDLKMANETSIKKACLSDSLKQNNPNLVKKKPESIQEIGKYAVDHKFATLFNSLKKKKENIDKGNSSQSPSNGTKHNKIVEATFQEFQQEKWEASTKVSDFRNSSHKFKEDRTKADASQHLLNSSDTRSRSAVEEEDCLDLAYWGLPSQVISAYQSRNIDKMFQWQYDCLSIKNVLNGKNLVYSAPTSAGKTLVAEILMLKKVIESKKKAMMILPFVSVVREKVNYFQEMFQDSGVVVGGYMGAHRPPGGFKAIDIAICTIEKANNLINRLMEEKRLDELGILVVDELHMLGDSSRGYLLELLLTKLLYNCKKNDINIQIIGMSATLPNLNVLSFWLNAELYHTDFRPIPLHEMYKIGPVVYDSKTKKHLRELRKNEITFANDSDHSIYLAIETVASGNGVLVFCPSKNWCETLATSIAREIYNVGRPVEHKNPAYNSVGQNLREYVNGSLLSDILLQLKNSPAGLDPVLKLTVPFGVAFHHAGLTFDERDIIEGAFKQGILKVLVATTTLSSGVNLPARRVLIRSPLFCGNVIDTLSYKQMVGRAGRKGIDDQGESILLCKESERKFALQLVTSELQPVQSCLLKSGKDGLHSSLKRALIEVIASGVAVTHEEVMQYASCTLLFASLIQENIKGEKTDGDVKTSLNKCLDYLLENDFIFKNEKKNDDSVCVSYKPTQLGTAILASGFSPQDSLRVLKELQLARRCFVLENDLHILYEVTPPYLSDQMGSINWMNFLSLWEQLPEDYRRVGELVGVRESFIGLGVQGKIKTSTAQGYHKLAVHQRFYAALALNDLIQEVPLAVVSEKYNCNKGILQSLQQTTSTFSGMLTIFCNRLGWYNLELLFSQFQKRVHFGIQQELCDLIQLSTLNAQRARILYNAGYETISSLACADPEALESILCNAGSFESEKQLDGDIAEEVMKRREVKRIRITGKQGMNEKEVALFIIQEAQNFIKHELGIKAIAWNSPSREKDSSVLHKNLEQKEVNNPELNNEPRNLQNTSPSSSNANKSRSKLILSMSDSKISNKHLNLNASIKNQTENLTSSVAQNNCKLDMDTQERLVEKNLDNFLKNDNKGSTQRIIEGDPKVNYQNSDLSQNKLQKKAEISKSGAKCSQSKISLELNGEEKQISQSFESFIIADNEAMSNVSKFLNNFTCETSNRSAIQVKNMLNINREVTDEKLNNSEKKELLNLPNISKENIKNISNKNESFFYSKDINDLFDELEKSMLDANQETSPNCTLNNIETAHMNNNLTFNQILLSQSAEVEDVYFAHSVLNSGFQSISDCLDENPIDPGPPNGNILKMDEQNSQLTKNTKDILDAIFDSPVSEVATSIKRNTVAYQTSILHKECSLHLSNIDAIFDSPICEDIALIEKNVVAYNHQTGVTRKENSLYLSNVDKIFESPTFENRISDKNETIYDHHTNASLKYPLQLPKNMPINNIKESGTVVEKNRINANLSNCQKCVSQSTPIDGMDKAKYMDNLDFSIDSYSNSPIEDYKFDFPETKSSMKLIEIKNSESPEQPETSGDLFDSEESLVSGSPKMEVKKTNHENLEKMLVSEDNIQSVSSCSDDLFGSDQSFEKMLQNSRVAKQEFPTLNVKQKNVENDNCYVVNTEICMEDRLKKDSKSRIPTTENGLQFSPTTVAEFCLEKSGDLFEDSAESEPIFKDPKKQLSFSFEDNSEIFKTWNPSPNKHSDSIKGNKVSASKEIVAVKENNSNNENDHSFLANVSHFSSFSSNSLEGTPLEHKQKSKTASLETSASQSKNSSQVCVIKVETKNKTLQHANKSHMAINGISSNSTLSFPSSDEINFNVIDVTDENFDSFLKLLEKTAVFGLSVACERTEHKDALNIGPPNLRAKKCSTVAFSEKIFYNSDILIAGLSFCWNEKVFFVSFPSDLNNDANKHHLTDLERKLKQLQQLFHNFTRKKVVMYDLKSYYKVLQSGCNIILFQKKDISYFDPSIAAWLLDPSEGRQTLQELVLNYWPDASHLIENFDRVHGSLGLQYWSSVCSRQRATTEAYLSFHLIEILSNHLKDKKLFKSFIDVEMPSILSLAKMEQIGLGFDLKVATNYRAELQKKQDILLKNAHQLAGRRFNIMSTKDLSRILYKEMKLSPPDANCSPVASRHLSLGSYHSSAKKLPPELKTNKECLEKIMHLHPLPKTVMDWRKLSFAISKVLMPLLRENKFDKDFQMHRLHSTCYVYTVTGRINMHTPNLQFIPRDFSIEDKISDVNSDLHDDEESYPIEDEISLYGVSLRNMFVPAEGNILLSADYSQLELRILAHLSGDVKLLKSLNSGDDIFKQIAATWKNMCISSITDDLRQQAKKICYGIIYGMSAKTLSHQLKSTEAEATYFMETFKKSYPGMTHYLNLLLNNCQAKGYVTTIMERRRYLPHILSEKKGERSQAERQAINTTIQGSAADIIKKAMIEIEKQFRNLYKNEEQNFASTKKGAKNSKKCFRGGFLVLQLHDELMYEVNKYDLETVKNIVKTVMEKNTRLSVVLPVNIKVGLSWGSMKKVI